MISRGMNAALWTAKTVAEGGTGDFFYAMAPEGQNQPPNRRNGRSQKTARRR